MAFIPAPVLAAVLTVSLVIGTGDGASQPPVGRFLGIDIDFNKIPGIWYAYMEGPEGGAIQPVANPSLVFQRLGRLKNGQVAFTAQVQRLGVEVDQRCSYLYIQENTTCDGLANGVFFISNETGPGEVPIKAQYRIKALDDNVFIRFLCAGGKVDEPTSCKQTAMFVFTRKPSTEMTALEKAYILDQTKEALRGTGIAFDQLVVREWDPELPACEWANKPKAFRSLVRSVQAATVSSCPGDFELW